MQVPFWQNTETKKQNTQLEKIQWRFEKLQYLHIIFVGLSKQITVV